MCTAFLIHSQKLFAFRTLTNHILPSSSSVLINWSTIISAPFEILDFRLLFGAVVGPPEIAAAAAAASLFL